jgi:UDP-N-acetyl-2-amino-2-deoxyglucuronate dehydrogenase
MSITFAIIGCGRIAKRHAEQIAKVGKLVAVCDVMEEKANEMALLYAAKAYYNIDDLLANEKNINIVSVCSPNGLHATHSISCLKAGMHVLCEKPMSIKLKDAKEMVTASLEANRKLFVVKSARYNPLITALKQLIEEDKLGKLFSFNLNCVWNRPNDYYADSWRGTNEFDGGTLYTQFSHYIDLVIWLFSDYRAMNGIRKNFAHASSIAFEDTGIISLEMKNGSIGTIHYTVNAVEKNQEIALNIVAEKATITLGGAYLNEIIYQVPTMINESVTKDTNGANDYGFYKGSASNHDKVYENVIKALNGEKNDTTDGIEAIKTVQFIEDFYNTIKLT